MNRNRWTAALMAGLAACFALVWVLSATGAVDWEIPLKGGMTQYSLLYSSDAAHVKQITPGTSGQLLSSGGTAAAPSWVNGALGVGTGYKIARGLLTLDGSNPSSASHGLTTVESCTLANKRSAIPTASEPHYLTWATSSGTLDVYAWSLSGTIAASTDANDIIGWICVGT